MAGVFGLMLYIVLWVSGDNKHRKVLTYLTVGTWLPYSRESVTRTEEPAELFTLHSLIKSSTDLGERYPTIG